MSCQPLPGVPALERRSGARPRGPVIQECRTVARSMPRRKTGRPAASSFRLKGSPSCRARWTVTNLTVATHARSRRQRMPGRGITIVGAFDRVIAEGERALAIRPDYVLAMMDVGSYYVIKGDALAARTAEGDVVATEPARAW